MAPLTPAQQNTLALMQAFGFDSDELMLNRSGRHSHRQAGVIAQGVKARSYTFGQIGIAIFGMFIAGFLISLRRPYLMNNFGPGVVIAVMVAAVFGFLAILLAFSAANRRRRPRNGQWPVNQATGPVQVRVTSNLRRTDGDVATGWVRIGRARFAVWGPVLGAFRPGLPYTIYYVGNRRGGIPISAEALETTTPPMR